MGDDPFEKILRYIEEQRKMPHVATNIALKELTWPPASKKAAAPPKDLADTFPKTDGKAEEEKEEPAAPAEEASEKPAPEESPEEENKSE